MTESRPYILSYAPAGHPVRHLSFVTEPDDKQDASLGAPADGLFSTPRTSSPTESTHAPSPSFRPWVPHAMGDVTEWSVPDVHQLEWATDTDSTASDLTGPGRIYDNFIGRLARPLELAVNGAPRPPRPVLPTPPTMSQASFITDSDAATDEDNPGPGRLVGKVISWGGRHIERFATYAAVKTGRGPYAPIESFLAVVERQVRAGDGKLLCDIWNISLPKETRARHEALSNRLNHIVECWRCSRDWNSDNVACATTKKYLSRLLRLCNSSNITISATALASVTDIGASSCTVWRMLLKLRAETIVRHALQQAYCNFGHDSLLAHSRTALSCVSESGLMSLVPQLAILPEHPLGLRAVHLVSRGFSGYLRDTDTRYFALCAMSRYIITIGLALVVRFPVENLIGSVFDLLLDSPDCAERAIAIEFLSNLFTNPYRRSISWRYVDFQDNKTTVTRTVHGLGEDHIRIIHLIPHVTRKCCSVREAVRHLEKVWHRRHESLSFDIWVSCPLRGTWRLVEHFFYDPNFPQYYPKPMRFVRIT